MENTYKNTIVDSLEEFKDNYRAKLSEEARNAMNAVKTVDNIAAGTVIASAKQIQTAIALQMAHETSDQAIPQNNEIFADTQQVTFTDLNGNSKTTDYQVGACKAANIATGVITDEIVVYKAYDRYELSGETSKNIKTDIVSQEQNIFNVEDKNNATDKKYDGCIVKKSCDKDTIISTTIVPGSVAFPAEINLANQMSINLRSILLAAFIKEYKNCDKNGAVAVVRGMNRSYSENIFERVYTKFFGKLDEGNIDQVILHNELKDIFLANLQGIGSASIADQIIRIGMDLRKMSIAPNPKWGKNANKVKQNNAKFYYVSSSLTTGIITVPTTAEIVKANLGQINNLFHYVAILLERETRAENGLKYDKIELPKINMVPATNVAVEKILKISDASYAEVVQEYQTEVVKLADEVCMHYNSRKSDGSSDALTEILGKM